ncbi:hypothetical protein NX059_010337 [Plenodomus lindquistii]|nr:hypothetical protein NX059_010337 [Plenodomus lindquistii]
MTLEQHMYGSSDWHLPSPSSTPKSATFPDATLKTPKTESFPHSHFLDAWATPRVYEQQTPAHTPSFTLSTPTDRPSSAYSPALRTPEDPEFHVNHFVPQNLPLPPVEAARRLSSSPDPHQLRKVEGGQPPLCGQLIQQGLVRMDFSQMQTPPPTRDATSRRSLQQSGGSVFATPATVIHRTPYQAPPPEALFDQTPFGLVNVQYTPDMMNYPNGLPMSAPPMPQSRLFWDQANDVSHMDVDLPYQDPFGPTPHRVQQDVNWQALQSPATTQMQAQSFQSFQGMPSQGQMSSFSASGIGPGQHSQASSFVSTSAGVDPNMLFSFSNPGLTTSFGSVPQQAPYMDASRQPYETQTGSIRERETARKARSQHSRSNTNSSSGSVENIKPALQRSNTDSGFRKSRTSSIESRISAPAAASTIPRRMSPLKRLSGASLKSIPEIRRPRTRLIIDETGRARTETFTAEEEDTPKPARKPSQTDLRRQYPGLWEEDDTESDDDEPAPTISRNASFNIPQPQRRASKHARADSGNLDQASSFKILRPSSGTSSGAFDKASFEPARPIRKPVERPTRSFSMMEFPTPVDYASTKECSNQAMPDSPGDALGALKKVVAGRQQRVERASHNTLKAHNQRWAQASADMNSPHGHGQYDPFSNSFNGSPTTNTPSTDRSSLSNESTRCICHGSDEGQPMVQCESCTKWLHIGCLGFNASNLPPVYVCVFCTGSTPVARGGRVRGPIPFDSPLNHKTIFRR